MLGRLKDKNVREDAIKPLRSLPRRAASWGLFIEKGFFMNQTSTHNILGLKRTPLRLKEVREQRRLTQHQLSELSGLGDDRIFMVELSFPVKDKEIIAICNALQLPPNAIDWPDWPEDGSSEAV